jgi:hypothetical protein
MTLKEHIAKTLMHSRIGMTRKELASAIDVTIYENNIDRISDQLFRLKKSSHVEGSFTNGRWSITPQGRAYYSDLNDDETDNQSQPVNPKPILQPVPLALDSGQESETETSEDLPKNDPISPVVLDTIQEPILQPENDPQTTQTQNAEPIQDYEMAHTPLTYDPFGDIYNQLQQAQHMLQNLKLPESPRIQHKQEKLATLRLVQQTIGLFNGDVEDILQQIYQDLDQMEAA